MSSKLRSCLQRSWERLEKKVRTGIEKRPSQWWWFGNVFTWQGSWSGRRDGSETSWNCWEDLWMLWKRLHRACHCSKPQQESRALSELAGIYLLSSRSGNKHVSQRLGWMVCSPAEPFNHTFCDSLRISPWYCLGMTGGWMEMSYP